MIKTITFATSNKGKALWLESQLQARGLTDWSVEAQKLDLIEIQSDDLAAISLSKARQAYEILKRPVLVMDGGFFIKELNGFPGPYATYFIEKLGAEKIAKLASILDDKSCYFKNVATYMDGPDRYVQFSDDTGDILTLTDQVWPHDNPKQLSVLWKVVAPSEIGYNTPLAGLGDDEIQDYLVKRDYYKKSVVSQFIDYLQEISGA